LNTREGFNGKRGLYGIQETYETKNIAAVTRGRRGGKAKNAKLIQEPQNAMMAEARKGNRLAAIPGGLFAGKNR
jgi:hypothetical protein